ncbi:MAG: lysophospholipid acyltransferase family protein [Chthoniobacteraceae bacterium]
MTGAAPRWTFAEALLARAFRSTLCRALWIKMLRRCFGFEFEGVENVPREKAVIFAGNHASHYDGLFSVTMAYLVQGREPAAVAFSKAGDFPIIKQIVRTKSLDLIFADPLDPSPRARAVVLGGMIDRLEDGRSIVVHVEGHRRDTLGEFMPGAAVAARASGAPIVPFTLIGVLPLWKKLPWPDRWTGRVRVRLHPQVEPEDYAGLRAAEGVAAMTAELRRRVASAIDYEDSFTAPSA